VRWNRHAVARGDEGIAPPPRHHARESENEGSQLIERKNDLKTDEGKRGNHQIIAKMHERLETKCSARTARILELDSDALKERISANALATERSNWNRRPPPPRK
jgi:hypothetical protein